MTSGKTQSTTIPERYHHGDLKNALITAAAELIAETGADGFAMIDAAKRAGVSNAAPYRHFKDKDALLQAVAELGFFALQADMLDVLAQYERGSTDCIVELGKRYIHFVTSRPAFFDLMWGENGLEDVNDASTEHFDQRATGFWLLVDEVQAWCEREQLPHSDPLDITLKLWSMSIGLSHLVINHHLERFVDDADPYEILATSAHTFLQGVIKTAR